MHSIRAVHPACALSLDLGKGCKRPVSGVCFPGRSLNPSNVDKQKGLTELDDRSNISIKEGRFTEKS